MTPSGKQLLSRLPAPIRGPLGRYAWQRHVGRLSKGEDASREFSDPTGAPMPPARMRVLVSGDADPEFYALSGWAHNLLIRRLAEAHGATFEAPMRLLDFGCGCGRISRWWGDLDGVELHGCDYNPELLAWADTNVPLLQTVRNELEPPLPYEDGAFDLVYALSVFTHLDADLERAWARELARIVRPGGLALITTMGEAYTDELTPRELEQFRCGESVVHFGEEEGTNLCAAYHPSEHVEREILSDFEIVHTLLAEDGETGAWLALSQDLYLARRNESVASAIE